MTERPPCCRPVELVAPAGGPDAAVAAFAHGADAVYAGLRQFSARAEAENFTVEALAGLVADAHARQPPRRVYAVINTLILDRELTKALDALVRAAEVGVDAVIVQDVAMAGAIGRHLPGLRLHASTQMAAHNRDGVERLRDLGFHRVVLARELTLDEIRDCASVPGIEVEVFVHGALCHSYSGLCLASSLLCGRSGNRGRCAYLCRESYREIGGGAGGFLFSMKDLALGGRLDELRTAGVAALKIEGRMKTPLYVAAATRLHRKLLDGAVSPAELREMEDDLRAVFSRPWTTLHLDGPGSDEPVDTAFVGHRGAPLGRVEEVITGRDARRIRFRTARAIERHDGLQIDLPGDGRPFGFAVRRMFVGAAGRPAAAVFEAPAGTVVEVELPAGAPNVPVGANMYQAASQAVRRRLATPPFRPVATPPRPSARIQVEIGPGEVKGAVALERSGGRPPLEVVASVAAGRDPERNTGGTEAAARRAFGKDAAAPWSLAALEVCNPAGLFVSTSSFNELRRRLGDMAARALEADLARRVERMASAEVPPALRSEAAAERWRLKTTRLEWLEELAPDDLGPEDEVIWEIRGGPGRTIEEGTDRLVRRFGLGRVRLALPWIVRAWESPGLRPAVNRLIAAGWSRWEIGNPYGWRWLPSGADVVGDWPLYALNRAAVRQWLTWGLGSVVLSPEDGRDNLLALVEIFGDRTEVPVYADVPMWIAEMAACGGRRGRPGRCARECRRRLRGPAGEVEQVCDRGRSVTFGPPLCWADRLGELRAAGARRFRVSLAWRDYTPGTVRRLWFDTRAGRAPAVRQIGNYERGLE